MPSLGLRILSNAKAKHPEIILNIDFLRLLIRVLTQIGDIEQIRWIVKLALREIEKENCVDGSITAVHDESLVKGEDYASGKRNRSQRMAQSETKLRFHWTLLEDWMKAELSLNKYDIRELIALKDKRNKIRLQLEEIDHAKEAAFPHGSRDELRQLARKELFDSAWEVMEGYEVSPFVHLPKSDRELKERCVGRTSIDTICLIGKTSTQLENRSMGSDFHMSLSGLPVLLRDFLAQLPPFSGAQPDYDGFVRHMKTVILPPRPQPGPSDGDVIVTGGKRPRDELLSSSNIEDGDDDEFSAQIESKDFDLFRLRRREQLQI